MKPAYRTLPDDWLTVAESAQLLGISKVSVYKAINCGRLDYRTIEGRKCIRRDGLKTRYWGSSQRFADRPLRALAELAAAMPTDADLAAAMAPIDRWERVAELLTEYLGPTWPAPPWDGEQTATVAMALSLAQEAG
jgi:excisionase family DNA binding protein